MPINTGIFNDAGNKCKLGFERKASEMERKIRLTPMEVEHFVAAATRCDFDIDIAYNRYRVDAKSFLGVFGLDFTKVLTVYYNGYNEEFEELLKRYAIAC